MVGIDLDNAHRAALVAPALLTDEGCGRSSPHHASSGTSKPVKVPSHEPLGEGQAAGLIMNQSRASPALVFEDRMYPGEWRVDWTGEHGEVEVAISGRNDPPPPKWSTLSYGWAKEDRDAEVELPA